MTSIAQRLRQRYRLAMPKNRKEVPGQPNPTQPTYDCDGRSVQLWPGSATMISSFARRLLTIVACVTLAGCQSAPRFAWWKKEAAPDSSAVARSAESTLPSAQSTPQAVAVAGLTPAAPPSSTNLAAAGTPTAAPNISIPTTSPGTVAIAPPAVSQSANSLADKLASAPTKPASAALPTAPSATLPTATPATPLLAAVPSAGPYDPNGYKPGSAYGSNSASPTAAAASAPDRYGISSNDHYSTSPANAPQPAASQSFDRYGAPQAAATTTNTPAASPLATPTITPSSDRYANALSSASAAASPPLSSTPSAPPEVSPIAVATAPAPIAAPTTAAQLTAAPGQYRPGGTSSYMGSATTRPVQIASRPAPPSTPQPAAAISTAPATTSEPWAPPAANAYPATRTY